VTAQRNWPVAIIGSGNIGTDLLCKIVNRDGPLVIAAMVGIDPHSDGLARAAALSVPTSADGVDGLLALPNFADVELVFDATDAATHRANWVRLAGSGIRMIDLTPAAVGPYCVPAVNLEERLDAPNLNMVTCAGQAAVPIVAAVAQSGVVSYAEVVSSMSARSAGPGTRANIDELNDATAAALSTVGGAQRGKAVLLLNPANPPFLMRGTVFCLVDAMAGGSADRKRVEADVRAMVDSVARYVPGYRLKHRVQFETFGADAPLHLPETGTFTGTRVTVFLEIAGAGDYLPSYAGNIDMVTSAALVTAERIAESASRTVGAPQ
jgi:acetaldehyde dehydrogenase